ncbi:helix-turn-helix transcriptional regulator [Mycolicibacillus trivialis]|uniref:helix-turn-helix transcriptional regulator n=1 Tax=Mycolicibacillus trivialis TaxID=1798 RepID=UPI000A161C2D|nr:LuxR C-terminal-related transcriptional regulator [Mycolicibacillus trivialis]
MTLTENTDAALGALARLRAVRNNSQLADRIPAELRHEGFRRILFSTVRDNSWRIRSAYVGDDAILADALVRISQQRPRQLGEPLPEWSMLRTRRPILIHDAQKDPRVHAELAAAVKSTAYVAAPVYVWDEPFALLHADFAERCGGVDSTDRDRLGFLAEGIGAIFERNLTLERLRIMRALIDEHTREIALLAETFDSHIPGDFAATAEFGDDGRGVDERRQYRDSDLHAKLTQRERQVLGLLTVGKTNAQIASRLFISPNTVKSHIRDIMRKLQATNRTDAALKGRRVALPPSP